MPSIPYLKESKPDSFSAQKNPIKIAILLPLSGEYSTIGKQMLDAAQMGLFEFNDPNVTLIPADTKGTSFGATEAIQSVIKQDVKLVLGPLFSESTKVVVPIAKAKGINVVSFSNDKTLAGTGAFILGFRPEQQISKIVDYAYRTQQVRRFASVLPSNNYGATAAKELRLLMNRYADARLQKSEIYRLDHKGQPVGLDDNINLAYQSVLDGHQGRGALLLPEGGDRIEQIITTIKNNQQSAGAVQLLGSAQWYDDKLLSHPELEGAFFAAPPREKQQQFEQRFAAIYDYTPPAIASIAYDSIALAVTLSKLSQGADFSTRALTNPRGFMGVDGIFRLLPDGLSERGMAIISIQNGRFVIVEDSPNSFM